MTTNISRRLFITLFVIAIPTFTALAQTKESPSPDRFARLDALRVHYRSYGDGKNAIVFIHGWTCNLNFWKANIPAFSNRLRVIAIDLPGHGESDKPEITYSMDLFAQAIDAVLTDAGVERAALVGHSMGTPVIRQFYRKYPSKTLALVIVDGSLRPFGNTEGMKQFLDQLRASNYKAQAEQIVGFMVQPVKDKKNQEEIRAAMLSAPQYVMVGAWEAMLDEAIWKQDKINVPTLALMAKRTQWNEEYEKFVRELVPGIDYQVWEGVSHFLMMDDPQKFNETVLAFLEKNKLIK